MNILCERLRIEAPILQAPIGSASGAELVGAVSEAGGLGMLAGTWRSPDELRREIREIRARTKKPFAINLGVHAAPEEKIGLCVEEKVPVVSLFWGDARRYFETVKRGGGKVVATVGTVSEAIAAVDAGADAIIAQGFEAGGHVWGKIATLTLIDEVVAAIRTTPIVAAGGIGDGRAMAAAMALGAGGVCLGTRFVLASESLAHPVYQAKIISARAEDTFYGEVFHVGWPNAPHRVIRTDLVEEFIRGKRASGEDIVARTADGTGIPRYSSRLPVRGMNGEIEKMALYAGQSVGDCNRIQPAAEIVGELMKEASAAGAA